MPLFSSETILSSLKVGDWNLPIVRTTRKGSIALKTRAEQTVVLVPKHLSDKRLQQLLKMHQTWIVQALTRLQLRQQETPKVLPFLGRQGDEIELLGERYLLIIRQDRQVEPGRVELVGGECHVFLDSSLPESKHMSSACQAIERFMFAQARRYLEPALEAYASQIGVSVKSMTIKGYKSRWGSCYSDGRIQFNWRLMQAPDWVIDYVVVHELCHRIHANHSTNFWALVAAHYPKTADAKRYLKQHGGRWIQFLQS